MVASQTETLLRKNTTKGSIKASVLVATKTGCRVFSGSDEENVELPGRMVWAMAPDIGDACVAIVDGKEIWRRSASAEWSLVTTANPGLVSIASVNGNIFVGTMADAAIFRISANKEMERLIGFDNVPGRSEWFPNGPPLHIRAVTGTADGNAIMAAVHVGGIPRSTDGGKTWAPTIPLKFDVHEVRAHSSSPIVAAAAAVGLCVSRDNGLNWNLITNGLKVTESTESLAVAVLHNEALFSVQDGGAFAKRSQVWRWRIGDEHIEQVRDGLPEWLVGKVDTNHIAANKGQAAILDGGGNLWLSKAGSAGWGQIAAGLPDAYSVLIL